MAAPGPYETLGPSKSVGIAPAERAKTVQLQSRFKRVNKYKCNYRYKSTTHTNISTTVRLVGLVVPKMEELIPPEEEAFALKACGKKYKYS